MLARGAYYSMNPPTLNLKKGAINNSRLLAAGANWPTLAPTGLIDPRSCALTLLSTTAREYVNHESYNVFAEIMVSG